MRAVIQRANNAQVVIDGNTVGKINKGLVVLLGVSQEDTQEDILYMVDKIPNLRIFEDNDQKMNLSVVDMGYELLVISQFTIYGDCRKGRRPSFTQAAVPDKAEELYNQFVQKCRDMGIKVETGVFAADMKVGLENDGPVTIIIDSKRIF